MSLGRTIALALAPDLRQVLKKNTQARMRVVMALDGLKDKGLGDTLLYEELVLIEETIRETTDILRGVR